MKDSKKKSGGKTDKRGKNSRKKSARAALPERLDWKPGTMVYPLPAVLVSCGNAETGINLFTAAWTGTLCTEPAMCYISVRPSRYSYEIIKQTEVFVINLTTEKLARATDWCGVRSGRDYDKFKECGLTPLPAHHIDCPIVAEAPLAIECRVKKIIPLGSHDMFMAEVLGLNAAGRLVDPKTGEFALARAKPLVYVHGQYFSLGKPLGKFGFSVEKKKKR